VQTRWTVNAARLVALASLAITFIHLLGGRKWPALVALVGFLVASYLAGRDPQETTRMSKPNKRRYKLSQIREATTERVGASSIELETDDGQVFEFPAPHLWADDTVELARQDKTVQLAATLLGDRHQEFLAAGGHSIDVMMAVAQYGLDQGVANVGESSASSSS